MNGVPPWALRIYLLIALGCTFAPQVCLAQGDLDGAVVLSPRYMPELEQYIYRGAITPQPHFNPELYGILPNTEAWRVGHLQDDLWQWRTIEALTGERRPFILSQGQRSTNPAYQTAEFNYGLTRPTDAPDCSNCRTRNGFIRGLRSEHWAPYWRSVEHLIERGYRPIDSHNFIGLPRGVLVMKHIDAPVLDSGFIPTNAADETFNNYDPGSGYNSWLPDGVHNPVGLSDPELTASIDEELHNPGGLKDSDVPPSNADRPLDADSIKFSMTLPEKVRRGLIDTLPELDPGILASFGSLAATATSSNEPSQSKIADLIVVTPHATNPGGVSIKRLPSSMRWLLFNEEVQERYLSFIIRERLRRSVRGGLRRDAIGRIHPLRGVDAGLAVQYDAGKDLKVTTGKDAETTNMIIRPLSETNGRTAVDLAQPTLDVIAVETIATGTAATGASMAASAWAATPGIVSSLAAESLGAIAVVFEMTRRSADQHHLKLLYDQNSIEMGSLLTTRLMRRNGHLRDLGEISQEELVRRNSALARSAREEGKKIVKQAQWIGDRYRNIATGSVGTIGSAWNYWAGGDSN